MTDCCAKHVPIFADLDDDSLLKISTIAKHMHIKKGETLNSPVKPRGLFILSHGMAKVYLLTSSGFEKLVRILSPGDFTGLESLFDVKTNNYSEALTDINVCMIAKEDFMSLLKEHPSISIKLLQEYSRRVASLEESLLEKSFDSSAKRLANYFIKLGLESQGKSVKIPLPLKELAAFLGMTPETLSRSLKELEVQNAIKKVGIKTYDINMNKLRTIE